MTPYDYVRTRITVLKREDRRHTGAITQATTDRRAAIAELEHVLAALEALA